jgi:chromate transporter
MTDSASAWWGLFGHFLLLSLLSIGGAITTVPDMHRYLVTEQHWLSDAQFNASIAIAQAAPGPNVLFVAVLGWNLAGAWGALVTMAGILLPSTLLSLSAARWAAQRRDSRGVRAFTSGLMPLTLGLLLSTGWVLAEPYLRAPDHRGATLVLIAGSMVALVRTRLSPMWLVAVGALAGALGWI